VIERSADADEAGHCCHLDSYRVPNGDPLEESLRWFVSEKKKVYDISIVESHAD
jgi:hypothetical protein